MRKWLFNFLAFAIVMISTSAHAQPALKMMIPANPGGGWDQTGRHLADARSVSIQTAPPRRTGRKAL